MMRKLILSAMLAAIAVPTIPAMAKPGHDNHSSRSEQDDGDNDRHQDRHDNRWQTRQDDKRNNGWHGYKQKRQIIWQDYNRFDYNRPDPRYGAYYAERYYRDSSYYQPYRLSSNDRIYRGSNGRYYCRRNDGTTGLIIGALGGGLLGDAIAPRGSKTLGAILGGSAGALIGRSIGRDGVSCR